MLRLKKAYSAAWGMSQEFGEPLWMQWIWRVVIFGAPLFFCAASVYYGVVTGLWFLPILTVVFVLSSHPILTTFIYHDFYEIMVKTYREDLD